MSDTYTNGHDREPLTLAPMTLVHLPTVQRLYRCMLDEHQPSYPIIDADGMHEFIAIVAQCLINPEQPERWPAFVALLGERVVGFMIAERETRVLGKPKDILNVHWLVVDPSVRGAGIGRLLAETMTAWCIERAIPVAELGAFMGDTQWAARGWEPFLIRYQCPVEQVAATLAAGHAPIEAPITADETVDA